MQLHKLAKPTILSQAQKRTFLSWNNIIITIIIIYSTWLSPEEREGE